MKALIGKIYLYRIFSEFILLYPLYIVMFSERGGLSMVQISLLLGIWSLVILVAEIPTGALADKYSRKMLLVLAQLVRALGFGIWIFWPTFEGFLAGLALWGIGHSLTSGTFEALVFDELKAAGKQARYAKVIGRSESLAMFIGLGATLLAAPVFAMGGYEAILGASIAAPILAAFVAFTLPAKKKQEAVESMNYSVILKEAFNEVRRNHYLLKLIIFGVFVGVLFRIFDEYASLIISFAGTPTTLVPLVSAAVFLPVIVADFFAYKLEKMPQVAFMLFLVAGGGALMLAGKWLGPTGLVGFALFLVLIKASITVFNAKLQHAIAGKTRATITSMNGFGVQVAAIAGFLVYGGLAQVGGTSNALWVFGLATLVVGLSYLLATRGRMLRTYLKDRKL